MAKLGAAQFVCWDMKARSVAPFLRLAWALALTCSMILSPEAGTSWQATYDGPGHAEDKPSAIGVDAFGNVYVAGRSGNGTNDDYVTLKFNPAGSPVWARRFDGPGQGYDAVTALSIDGAGNVHVTGTAYWGTNQGWSILTIKYDPNGDELWKARYAGPVGRDQYYRWDSATAMTVDRAGRVYVAGCSCNTNRFTDYVTLKYDAGGRGVWTNRLSGPGESCPYAVAVDSIGQVYVTGNSTFTADDDDQAYATVKYSPDGLPLWTNRYHGGGRARALTVDDGGRVYVTGRRDTLKYGPDGGLRWARHFPGVEGIAIAFDRSSNLVVTGRSGYRDSCVVTVKYDRRGNGIWTNDVCIGDDCIPLGLAIDRSGHAIVGVNSSRVGVRTVWYNEVGATIWQTNVIAVDPAVALATDVAGNVYAAGSGYSPESGGDIMVARISSPLVPHLSIRQLDSAVCLSWSRLVTDVVLETTTNLSALGTWTRVTKTPAIVAGQNCLTNRVQSGSRFYRLRPL